MKLCERLSGGKWFFTACKRITFKSWCQRLKETALKGNRWAPPLTVILTSLWIDALYIFRRRHRSFEPTVGSKMVAWFCMKKCVKEMCYVCMYVACVGHFDLTVWRHCFAQWLLAVLQLEIPILPKKHFSLKATNKATVNFSAIVLIQWAANVGI